MQYDSTVQVDAVRIGQIDSPWRLRINASDSDWLQSTGATHKKGVPGGYGERRSARASPGQLPVSAVPVIANGLPLKQAVVQPLTGNRSQ